MLRIRLFNQPHGNSIRMVCRIKQIFQRRGASFPISKVGDGDEYGGVLGGCEGVFGEGFGGGLWGRYGGEGRAVENSAEVYGGHG